jgi:hypothetical protein
MEYIIAAQAMKCRKLNGEAAIPRISGKSFL